MGGGGIAVLHTSGFDVVGFIPTEMTPRHIVVTKDGNTAYVSCNLANCVEVIDLRMNKVIKSIKVKNRPRTIVLSPDNRYLYVVNYESDTLGVVNLMNDEVKYYPAGEHPVGVDVTPDGKYVWVTNYFPKCSLYIYRRD